VAGFKISSNREVNRKPAWLLTASLKTGRLGLGATMNLEHLTNELAWMATWRDDHRAAALLSSDSFTRLLIRDVLPAAIDILAGRAAHTWFAPLLHDTCHNRAGSL
jgi:hypothetical protein